MDIQEEEEAQFAQEQMEETFRATIAALSQPNTNSMHPMPGEILFN